MKMLLRKLVLGSLVLIPACNREQPLGPPEVQYGQTECSKCGMIVSDEHYAAGLILQTPQGERVPRVFDDIGCMLKYERQQKEGNILAEYVKDYDTRQWILAGQAVLVHCDEIQSPMGYGIAAASTRPEADRLSAGHSDAVSDFVTLRDQAPARTTARQTAPASEAGAQEQGHASTQ